MTVLSKHRCPDCDGAGVTRRAPSADIRTRFLNSFPELCPKCNGEGVRVPDPEKPKT